MATRNWLIANDASVLNNAYGNTVDKHHPAGLWIVAPDAYVFRAYMKFTMDFSSMITITSAILWMKSTTETHVGFGSSPTIRVKKLTATLNNTQGGSVEGSWSSTASPKAWVSSTTTDQSAATNMTASDSTWDTVDVTAMAQAWLAGGTHYGVEVKAENEGTEFDTWEFYSKDSSYDPYIVVTYTTNTVPDAPTSMTPTGGTVTGLTPTLLFTHSDAQSDPCSSYDINVSTDSTFASVTHWTVTNGTTGISGNNVTVVYAGTALTRGSTYYWRARTNDGTGDGAWSAAQQFKVASLPTTSVTEPSATGRLGKTSYAAGAGWASPRLNVGWSFNCADGGTQSTYEVEVYNDTAGSPGTSFHDTGPVSSTVQTFVVPATLVEGNYYHIRVQVKCSHNETSAFTGYFRIRTRWGASSHTKDLGSIPTSWSVSTLGTTTVGGSSEVVVEYNGSTDGTTVGTWAADLSSVALKRWVHYRIWMLVYGASPVTTPSLNQLIVSYTASVPTPDKWTREDTANSYASEAAYVYGTQSLQHTGDAGSMNTYQSVTVTPNTNYVLSGRIKSSGNSGAFISISTAGTTGEIVSSAAIVATVDWARYNTAIWNSGSNTSIFIRCFSNGGVGTYAWFDAIKMEASLVVTPWVPSFVGSAVVLDAGGLQIDGSGGGVFRYRGSAGGTRDRTDGGASGLLFGGDSEIASTVAGEIKLMPTAAQDKTLTIETASARLALLKMQVTGDTNPRATLRGDATVTGLLLGPGNAAQDVRAYRSAAKVLTLDDNAGAALTKVAVVGAAPIEFGGDVRLFRSGTKLLSVDDGTTVRAIFDANAGVFTEYADNAWTSYVPVLGGATGSTHSTIIGYYQKIGKMVFVRIYLVSTANATGSATLSLTTPSDPDRTTRQVLIGHSEGHTVNGAVELVAFTGGSGAVWDRIRSSTGVNMIGTDYDTGGIMIFQGVYAEA